VLKACIEENGMKFSDGQLEQLTNALYDDAVSSGSNRWSMAFQDDKRERGIRYKQFQAQMMKHPGLLEKLSIKYLHIFLAT